MNQRCDYLIFDISNLLYRTFFAQPDEDHITIAGLATHAGLTTLNKYYRQFKPNKKVIMAFDRSSWRKEYTSEFNHLKPYKGNRRQNMTPAQQAKHAMFMNHLNEFETLITEHTTIVTLAGDKLEADDLIAGFVQTHAADNITIISSDTDMAQLLKHTNVTLISPITDKPHTILQKFHNDPNYYLFQKCIRGDTTDNIQSAYPRVRSTRIKEIYDDLKIGDGFKYTNFMKEKWTDHLNRTYTVEDAFHHNKRLIDLEFQPQEIKDKITSIIEEINTEKRFSYVHILRFLAKYELEMIKKSLDNFLPLLSS